MRIRRQRRVKVKRRANENRTPLRLSARYRLWFLFGLPLLILITVLVWYLLMSNDMLLEPDEAVMQHMEQEKRLNRKLHGAP